jgi:hypothetical protein
VGRQGPYTITFTSTSRSGTPVAAVVTVHII